MIIKTTLIAVGALVVASAASLAPAQAGSVGLHFGTPGFGISIYDRDHDRRGWHRHHRRHVRALSPRQIRASLRRQGYHRIRGIDRRGRVYVARAVGFRNNVVRVTVNARNGRVIHRRVLAWR